MKTISVCFVAILFACWATAADYHEDILGNVSGNSAEDKFVQVNSIPLKVQERVIEFTVKHPQYIRGIKHIDFKSARVKFEVIGGGLGQSSVYIRLRSQRGHGINSRLHFYV